MGPQPALHREPGSNLLELALRAVFLEDVPSTVGSFLDHFLALPRLGFSESRGYMARHGFTMSFDVYLRARCPITLRCFLSDVESCGILRV